MILSNKKYCVSVSIAKVYENCIKDIDTNIIAFKNNIDMIRSWLPNISSIDVSADEMIVGLEDETEEINLGFTGYEWIFSDYVDSFYENK